ncbi:MAG TPA: hypothetical protein DCP90_00980 [Clostridiales bacterium]|nr:MAG: hypothetical protein A2Y22_07765 [Clostridiales bacterium GWD2_32_59]HAN09170.1 hypothetical protein [Clostridiales bacterium]
MDHDIYFDDVSEIFLNEGMEEHFGELEVMHDNKYRLFKIKEDTMRDKPIIIDFCGTPRAGKTGTIEVVKEFFKKAGFRVKNIIEPASYCPLPKSARKAYSIWTNNEAHNKLIEVLANNNADVVLCDRGICDNYTWVHYNYYKGIISKDEYDYYMADIYKNELIKKVDIACFLTVDPYEAIRRDYLTGLALEQRSVLNKDFLEGYNNSTKVIANMMSEVVNTLIIDTTHTKPLEGHKCITNKIMDKMEEVYLQNDAMCGTISL